jgi:hypothetical protein
MIREAWLGSARTITQCRALELTQAVLLRGCGADLTDAVDRAAASGGAGFAADLATADFVTTRLGDAARGGSALGRASAATARARERALEG